jgi:hypothetical protein
VQSTGLTKDTKAWFISLGSLEAIEVTKQCIYGHQLRCKRQYSNCYEQVYSVIQQVLTGTVQTLKVNYFSLRWVIGVLWK